ncbi:hypothetical protein PVE_R2G0260 [Pseudomonas veronii 1YdBTEX2]|uniref:Uncharacterized protein n=1 Tax=Pseudomonas veronii 1YdBTEX2 TaxID=1295141 RepID=A0A1D3K7H4_PSEVE|nr:hypothetical protein PVE_R2G0260 [Pseudomonas veronii 1YdBTEX2]
MIRLNAQRSKVKASLRRGVGEHQFIWIFSNRQHQMRNSSHELFNSYTSWWPRHLVAQIVD